MMSPRSHTSSPRWGVMRLMSLAAAAFVLTLEAAPAQSQDWSQYLAFEDFFSISFPGEPTVHETTYMTAYGLTLPARVYTAEDDFGTYSATAVDWREAEELHEAHFAACQASVGDLRGGDNPGVCGNRARGEIGGAILHAAFSFLKRGSEVTYFGQSNAEGVEGVWTQLLNEDGSRTYAAMHWHDYHLYIVEATAPEGMPPPSFFLVSIGFIDEHGRRIRYAGRYSPVFPVPPRSR